MKARLMNLRRLPQEIEHLQKRIEHAKQREVSDVVRGSSAEFPYTSRCYTVQGVSTDYKAILLWEEKKAKLSQELLYLEGMLDGVEDAELRLIVRLYFADGMTQQQIAAMLAVDERTIKRRMHDFYMWAEKNEKDC